MDFFELMKDRRTNHNKNKGLWTEYEYFNLLTEILLSMFKWENVPQNTNAIQIEKFLLSGACAIDKDGNAWACTPKSVLKNNGEYDEIIGTRTTYGNEFVTTKADTFHGTNGVNCVVGYNNYNKCHDYNLLTYADKFAQIELSMDYNIKYSRMNRIFKAKTQKEKTIIEDALKKAENGVNTVIVSDATIETLIGENGEMSPFIELTDVDKQDKLQYLSNFYQDTLHRFLTLYGLPTNNTTKLAQQTLAEVNDLDTFSQVIPSNMLACRREFCEKVNALFGFNMSVDFNPVFKPQYNTVIKADEEPQDEEPQDEKGGTNEDSEN